MYVFLKSSATLVAYVDAFAGPMKIKLEMLRADYRRVTLDLL
jgi:hypothetical protein